VSSTAVYGLVVLSIFASFVGALVSRWWWPVAAFAVLPLLLAQLEDPQASYSDGPGVGTRGAVVIGVINVFVWLIGRWIRRRVRTPT